MTSHRRRHLAGLLLAVATVGATLVGACADKKGALMLAINTDMKAPKDVNAVSVTISTNGAIKHSFIGRVTPQGDVLLPATLAIVEPDDKDASVRVRVMAFQDRKPRVLRDVRTTIPSDGRTALLRIPLNFVNDASAVGEPLPNGVIPDPIPGTGGSSGGSSGAIGGGAEEFDFFGSYQPPCPNIENDTIIDGECRDNFIDPATLPDFDQAALGDSTSPGACFDVAKCFSAATIGEGTDTDEPRDAGADGSTSAGDGGGNVPPPDGGDKFKSYGLRAITLDRGTCTLQLNGANPARLNLAIVTPDTGECVGPGECYVPIDRGAGGWTESGGRVQLPAFVCKLLTGKNLRLATSPETCAAKEDANPICRAASAGPIDGTTCTEFVVGAPFNPAVGGGPTSQVTVQSVSDYGASAKSSLESITSSCKMIAQQLNAPPGDQSAADGQTDPRLKANAWCTLATSAIGTTKAKAGGSISLQIPPPLCRQLVATKTICQSKCAGNVCDPKASPSKCTGGRLVGQCSGECTAEGGATVYCEGQCTAQCQGSCSGAGSVECAGVCTGTCTAGPSGSGQQSDGTCRGTCTGGTCSLTAPLAICTGTCNGACTGSCQASAGMPVKCDGKCSAEYEPLYCEGGRLEGGCSVDAKCDASCNVTVTAQAECPAPTVAVLINGAADQASAGLLRMALQTSLGPLLATRSRLEGMASVASTVTSSGQSLSDIKASCIPVVVKASNDGVQDAQAALVAVNTITNGVLSN